MRRKSLNILKFKVKFVEPEELDGDWGEYWWKLNLIKINKRLGDKATARTIVHEIMHAAMEFKRRKLKKKNLSEEDICECAEPIGLFILNNKPFKELLRGRKILQK